MLVRVEITAGTVATSQYGSLVAGDVLRTSPEFARHLVEDCKAAKYLDGQQETQEQAEAKPPPRARRRGA